MKLQDLIWAYYQSGSQEDFEVLLRFCLDQCSNDMAIELLKLRALERIRAGEL